MSDEIFLAKDEWQSHLDDLFEKFDGATVTIEEIDDAVGQADSLTDVSLALIEYDPKDDVFMVEAARGGSETLRRMIPHPVQIIGDLEPGDYERTIEVQTAGGAITRVHIHRES
jgi:hypothetical protein